MLTIREIFQVCWPVEFWDFHLNNTIVLPRNTNNRGRNNANFQIGIYFRDIFSEKQL